MTAMFFVFLFSLLTAARAEGFELNQMPIFHDGQWKCEEPVPEIQEELGLTWGKSRSCVFKKDKSIAGTEVFAFGSVSPFYKRWRKGNQEYHHALRVHGQWAPSLFSAAVDAHVNAEELLEGRDKGKKILVSVTFTVIFEGEFLSQTIYNPDYYDGDNAIITIQKEE